jgi:hypothetical protein
MARRELRILLQRTLQSAQLAQKRLAEVLRETSAKQLFAGGVDGASSCVRSFADRAELFTFRALASVPRSSSADPIASFVVRESVCAADTLVGSRALGDEGLSRLGSRSCYYMLLWGAVRLDAPLLGNWQALALTGAATLVGTLNIMDAAARITYYSSPQLRQITAALGSESGTISRDAAAAGLAAAAVEMLVVGLTLAYILQPLAACLS